MTVIGSGPGGRIVDADVLAATSPAARAHRTGATAAGGRSAVEREAPAAGTRIALRGVRKRTAENMTAAWQAVPHVDSFHEIDVTDLFTLRDQLKPIATARGVQVDAHRRSSSRRRRSRSPTTRCSTPASTSPPARSCCIRSVTSPSPSTRPTASCSRSSATPTSSRCSTSPPTSTASASSLVPAASPPPSFGLDVHRVQPRRVRRLVRHLVGPRLGGRHRRVRPRRRRPEFDA